ncbi:ABC transporter ATP-binding protein [Desulfococcaceae bacterium HSG7]|nr:ABC transporter ATP-binding protein [Desulfococcaceae bacterium HSG7]
MKQELLINETVKRIFALLTATERRKLYWLFTAMILMAFVEVAGVGSIMPFMSVLANPDIIVSNQWLNLIYTELDFTSTHRFLFFLGLAVLIILIINNTITAFIVWRIYKFAWRCNHSLSKRLLETYLYQPYSFFLNRNSASLGKNILDEIVRFSQFVLLQLIMVIKNIVLMLSIFGLLLFFDPLMAVIVLLFLGSIYLVFFSFINKTLNHCGQIMTASSEMRFKFASEALNGIKELKILSHEQAFLNKFSIHSLRFANSLAMKRIISKLPKYVLEIIAFGGILLIVLYNLAIKQNMDQIVPLLSLYTFAAYRLMPALQGIFTGISEIRFNVPGLDVLYRDMIKRQKNMARQIEINTAAKPMKIKKQLVLKNMEFVYSGMNDPIIRNFNLNIQVNTTVGFAGPTGSGKTTVVDIILGLLTPDQGCLSVDATLVNKKNVVKWQKNIGYVTQDIFIFDDTIANNIAFGISDDDLNWDSIKRAARAANLHDFVVNNLPEGYHTIVGERGVRLSGGQRQRIGIARALYHDPEVLILDEATNSLDGITENAVMQAIHNLSRKKTIIMIAHRLTTLKDCNIIYLIEQGQITAQGTYTELMQTNTQFREMVQLSEKQKLF